MKQDTVEESKIEEIKTTSENTKTYDAIDYFWQDEDIKTIQELIGEAANVSIDEKDKAVLNIKAPQTKYINGGIINGSDVLIDAITEYVHKQYPELEIKVINSGTTFILQDKVTWKSKKDITEESKKIQESQASEYTLQQNIVEEAYDISYHLAEYDKVLRNDNDTYCVKVENRTAQTETKWLLVDKAYVEKMKELENNYKQEVDEDNKIEESYRVHWTYIDKKDNKHFTSKGHFLTIEEAQAFVNELKKKPISQQGPVDEPEIKTESKSLEEGAKEDLGIEPGSDEEAEGTLTESVNIGDKVKILNSNELHNNKQGEVTYIDDDIITVKLDNGRSFNYDKNQVQKIEEGVEEGVEEKQL